MSVGWNSIKMISLTGKSYEFMAKFWGAEQNIDPLPYIGRTRRTAALDLLLVQKLLATQMGV